MDCDLVIRRWLTIFVRKIIIRIIGPVYENYFGWRLRHNGALYELLDRPDIVKYIKFRNYNGGSYSLNT